MKIVAKYRTSKGDWAFVRCPRSKEKRIFISWREVEDYFNNRSYTPWKAARIT